ncbi:hypothetical protein [uncultured Microbacterium sp.]|uniref:DUF6414 family protein n=1 Tax=uncultured Microbacterium sp. TaxID=191216 RepID=UPI002601DBA9|nr:hypothetical protein [uncultured Microbacterium sp.]
MPVAVGAGQPGRDGVQIDNLHRGDLVEVAVRLEGADVFQVQAVIRSMIEVVNSYPELLEVKQRSAILNGEPIAALLDSLSRGLIPIEGEAIDLQVVHREGKALLVSGAPHGSGLPVRIAGVTLEGLYWQDVRRVLFSRGEYRMLVRLLHDGVRERWSPVKITEILSHVSSDLAATIDDLGPTFLGSLRDGARRTIVSEDLKAARIAALTGFAARLRSAAGAAELDRHTGSRVTSVAVQVSSEAHEGAEWWKGALNRVADAALGEVDERVSPVDLAALRSQVAEPTLQGSTVGGEPPPTPHLEVEVVAIYW